MFYGLAWPNILTQSMGCNWPVQKSTEGLLRLVNTVNFTFNKSHAYSIVLLMRSSSAEVPDTKSYFPTASVRSCFNIKYNLKYGSNSQRRFSRRGYLAQVIPSCAFNRYLQYVFKIESGKGNIRNVDQSMCAKYNPSTKSFTVRLAWSVLSFTPE